jgi:hypothetical protein
MVKQVGSVEVGVNANLDNFTKGLDQAKKQAQDFGTTTQKQLDGATDSTKKLGTEVGNLGKRGDESLSSMKGLDTAVNAFKQVASSALGPLAGLIGLGGLGGIAYAANQAIASFGQLQVQENNLTNSLSAVNNGLGVTQENIESISRTVSRSTGAPINELTQAFIALGREGVITGDTLERAVKILPDLATRTGGVSQAVQTLNEVLKKPSEAYYTLQAAGIRFTDQQKESLEEAEKFNDALGAQGTVLDLLEQQLGGTAASQNQGVVGSYRRLSEATAELFTNLGGVIERFLGTAKGAQDLAGVVEDLNKNFFPKDIQERVAALDEQIVQLNLTIDALNKKIKEGGVEGFAIGISGAVGRHQEELRQAQLQREAVLQMNADNAALIGGDAFGRQRAQQNLRVQQDLEKITGELSVYRDAINRADLAARQFAQREGLAYDDARVTQYRQAVQKLTEEKRRLAEADRPGILQLENERIDGQTKLLQYNTNERQVQQEILRVELQLKRRHQELEDDDRKQLTDKIRLLRELQRATATVEQAATAVFTDIGNSIADFAATGKFNFHQLAESMIRDLIRIGLQAYVIKPLVQSITGIVNPMLSSAYGVGAAGGAATAGAATGAIPTFQHGGSFTVPGSGGADRPSLLLGLGPGERVDITPAARARQGGAGGAVQVNNHIYSSKDMDVQQHERRGPNGETIIEQVFTEVMKRFGRGDADPTMAARFGIRQRAIQR